MLLARCRRLAASLLVTPALVVVSGPSATARAADVTPPVIDSVGCSCYQALQYTTVTFTAVAHDDESGVASTTWAFSDGQVASGSTVSHQVHSTGPLTATVTVTDAAGNASTASTQIYVTSSFPVDPSFQEPFIRYLRLRPRTISASGLTPGVPRRARLVLDVRDEFGPTALIIRVTRLRDRRLVARLRLPRPDDGRRVVRLGARFGGERLSPGAHRVVLVARNRFGDEQSAVRLRVVR